MDGFSHGNDCKKWSGLCQKAVSLVVREKTHLNIAVQKSVATRAVDCLL